MSFARASAICAAAFGLFLAGCSSHSGAGLVPTTPATDAISASTPTGTESATTSPISTMSTTVQTSTTTVQGTISNLTSTRFIVYAGSTYGYVPVYKTSSTTVSTHNASLSNGAYAIVAGTGSASSSVTASSINVYPTNPSGSTAPSGTLGSTTMKHILTGDYLLGRYGTHAVSPATAAAHLSWAQTSVADANAIAAAGIKTQLYVDPNRWETTAPMYYGSNEAMFAHTCGGSRITSVFNGVVRYVTNPNSSALQSHFYSYVKAQMTSAHIDGVFEDDSGTLSQYAPYTPFSAMPCGYTDGAWIYGERNLDQHSPVQVWTNSLNGLNGHNPSLALGILAASNTTGGVYEHCYTDNSEPKMNAWEWQAIENTELKVIAGGDTFLCMARNSRTASTQVPERIYALASFLLTYNPQKSVYWTQFATPSGLHVMPETKLVALNPMVGAPSSVTGLLTSSGNYVREYGSCYLGGTSVGPCAAIVNIDRYGSHPNPFAGRFLHTLTMSGNGVLDGGTVSTAGPSAPSTIPANTAYIVFR